MHRATARISARARRGVAILTTLALAAGLAGLSQANATTSIVPLPAESGANGPIVRNDSINLNVDTGGRLYTRTSSSGNFALQSSPFIYALAGCLGDNTAAGGRNQSPRSQLTVTGPGTTGTVLAKTSPAKNVALNGAETVITPPPAPGNNTWLGGPWSTSLSLSGKPAGVYTVTTTITNKLKTGFGACTTGTPGLAATPGTPANTFTAGDRTESWTFEYRPWQEKFSDLLGTGTIQMNVTPEEFQFDVSSGSSPIITGAAAESAVKLYSVPTGFEFELSLPNPGACGRDPLSCLPDTAVNCDPALGCTPRLATINFNDGANKLVGLFDFDTKAFAAVATAGGRTRVLFSGGTQVDGLLHDLLDQLNATAAQLGIDLPALLGTTVDLNLQRPDGSTDVIRISLLRALEIFNVPNGPATGVGVFAPITLGAGVILHTGAWTAAPDPAYTAPDGTQHSGYHYTVTEASALPALPSLPAPLNILVPPGKIKHVNAKLPAGGGTHSVLIGADTEFDPATGLPVHLPLLSTPAAVADNGIDFVGAATVVTVPDTCVLGFCFGGGLTLGTGVATFGTSPLPVNLGSLPLLWGDQLGLATVMASVDELVAQVSTTVLTNPAVTDLLASLPLGDLLGGGVPGLPGGGTPGGGLPVPGGLPLPGGGLPLPGAGLPLPGGGLPLPGGGLPGGLPGLPGGELPLLGGLPLGDLLSGLPIGSLFSNLPLIF